MLQIGPLDRSPYISLKSLISFQEIFAPGCDLGTSSGWPTDLLVEKNEPEPFLHGLNQFPGLAVGHAHLVGSLMQRTCMLNLLQKLMGAFTESLSMVVEPDFIGHFHVSSPTVILG